MASDGLQVPGGGWVTLEGAAAWLRVSQQTLWRRFEELGVEVVRAEVDGRQVSAVRRADLSRLGAAPPPERERPAAVPPARAMPVDAANEVDFPPQQRSLWQQLRELEVQRDRAEFELRVVRTQMNDSRERLQQADEALRSARAELERQRNEAAELRERLRPLHDEHLRAATALGEERQRRASLERQLAALIEIEEARERYCDRLEARLAAPRRYARGA